MIPTGAHWSRMFARFVHVRKTSEVIESVTNRAAKLMTKPTSGNQADVTPHTAARTPERSFLRAHAGPDVGSVAQGGPHDLILTGDATVELADDPPLAHDEHAMRKPQDFLHLGRDEHDGHPRPRERVDELVDRILRADVDPARRLVGNQHPRRPKEPLREQDLLLVAARQRRQPRTGIVCADVELASHLCGVRAPPGGAEAHLLG